MFVLRDQKHKKTLNYFFPSWNLSNQRNYLVNTDKYQHHTQILKKTLAFSLALLLSCKVWMTALFRIVMKFPWQWPSYLLTIIHNCHDNNYYVLFILRAPGESPVWVNAVGLD